MLLLTIQFGMSRCATVDSTSDVAKAHSLIEERTPTGASQPNLTSNAPLSLNDAIGIAISNDALLQKELAIVVQRSAELTQAEQFPNPSISSAFGIATDGMTGAPIILRGMQGLSWLWTRPDKIASADAALQQSILNAAQRAMVLKRDVSIAYQNLVHLKQQHVVASKLLTVSQAHLQSETELFQIGEASFNQLEAKTKELGQAELTLNELQEKVTLAYLELAKLLGHPTSYDIAVQEQPEHIAISLNDFVLEELLNLAQSQRFDLLTTNAVIQQRTAQLRLASPPELTGTVAFNENFNERKAVMPGINFTVQLDRDAKDAIADAILDQAVAEHLHQLRTAQNEVQTSLTGLTHAASQLEIIESTLIKPTQNILSNNRLLQREGEIASLEVQKSEIVYLNALLKHIQQQQSLAEAYYSLQFAVGGTFKTLTKEEQE